MDFELPETCAAVVEAAGTALAPAALAPAALALAGLAPAGLAPTDDSWAALDKAGLLSLSVPEHLGGSGLGVLESLTVLTEIGKRGLALPALATLALGVLPIVRWGTRAQQEELLTGSPILTAATRGPLPRCDELRVTGAVAGVPYADQARAILVPVALLEEGGTALAVVDPATAILTRTPASSPMAEFTVTLDGATATGLLPSGAVADLHQLALAGACALGDGVLAGALELTRQHIGTRVQFGKPIASFQAAAAQIADVYVAARTLHLATLSAGWRLSTGLDASTDLAVAGYWLATQAPTALRTCHHLHGGIGLDVTYPMHRYSALAKDLVRFVGGADARLDALAALEAEHAH